MSDLVVLTADKPMEAVVRALLRRTESIGIRAVDTTWLLHSDRDSGVRTTGHSLLRAVRRQHDHALMFCDHEGSGTTTASAVEKEGQLDEVLAMTWQAHGRSIVIEPELDVWLWGSDERLIQSIGWKDAMRPREWLVGKRFEFAESGKPIRPKEAMQALFEHVGLPMSAAVYGRIARGIGLRGCSDAAFDRLRSLLQTWFPV